MSINSQVSAFAVDVLTHILSFYRSLGHSPTHTIIQERLFLFACEIYHTATMRTNQSTYLRFIPSPYAIHSPSLSYRGGWHRVCQGFFFQYFKNTFLKMKKTRVTTICLLSLDKYYLLIPYADMLDQTFAHCQIFFTAAANADGPCFSPTVAFTPFRKAMDHWLGKLSPSQLPNPNQKFIINYSMIKWY